MDSILFTKGTDSLQLLIGEVERRLADLRAGKAREYSASEVFQSVRMELRQHQGNSEIIGTETTQ
ncbi:MAG: hypothetical protein JJE30_01825 [Desulfuromonadales bacterium]|nr:hypothetical protein [Desulfuromonadales bacterium]